MSTSDVDFTIPPTKVVDGDTIRPGPDGHIRHPKDSNLVWWEFADGTRAWVRQNRWCQFVDILTERAPKEPIRAMEMERSKRFRKELRAEGVRYKVKIRPFTDWNADDGPWEAAT